MPHDRHGSRAFRLAHVSGSQLFASPCPGRELYASGHRRADFPVHLNWHLSAHRSEHRVLPVPLMYRKRATGAPMRSEGVESLVDDFLSMLRPNEAHSGPGLDGLM